MTSMRTRSMRKVVGLAAIAVITLAFTVSDSKRATAASAPAEQVVFSGIGFANQGFQSRVGFWIWCTAEGNGPYADAHVCAGSVYVYRVGITVGVHGFLTEEADGTYTMQVFSNKDDVLSATLHNVSPELNNGPNNTVEFDVLTEFGQSIGQSTSSVVNVTGPGN